ncbi:MAG: hypothetical protein CML21_00360 [Rheinheimera sp.]|nr:hypothetical protein [Rheinheimera sp.]|tara:strand:- start:839 stop:1078 length:240 start_codon:yes stop_codon:yes gene_type:complete
MDHNLIAKLQDHVYKLSITEVTFNNGCWFSLVHDENMYFGTNPYGIDWFCDASRIDSALPKWIEFWNAPRDERENLLTI